MIGYTLHEIAIKEAKKQPGMVDSLTEDSPVLRIMRWRPASHGLWNVAEKLNDIKGPSFVGPDMKLPHMSMSTELTHTDLHVLGGVIEVPTQRALKMGGRDKYFADRQDYILKKAGMDTEIQIITKNWLRAALSCGNVYNAGGKGQGWFILAVRFCELNNVGLYDPGQFDQGRLLQMSLPYNGAEHYLHSPEYTGVLGYSIVYRGNFGWQIIDPSRCFAAIVNIDESNKPSPLMLDEMLADVRAQPGSTYLIMCPKAKIYGINPYKLEHIQLVNNDTQAKTVIESWNGIPIITTHNIGKVDNVKLGA